MHHHHLQVIHQLSEYLRFALNLGIIGIGLGHRNRGRVVVSLGLRVFFLLKVKVGQTKRRMRALKIVVGVCRHRLGQLIHLSGGVLVNAVDLRQSIVNLVVIILVLLLRQHLVQLLDNLRTLGRTSIVIGGQVHSRIELQVVVGTVFGNPKEIVVRL